MNPVRTLLSVFCATLVLGISAGVCDPFDDSERHLRSQRVRAHRAARLDCDHEVADHAHDMLTGVASSTAGTEEPLPVPVAVVVPETFSPPVAGAELIVPPPPNPPLILSTTPGQSRAPPQA